ncbi:MAG: SDR family NAD(P)-dependent oxidoreductase [Eubacteriales bacterium]
MKKAIIIGASSGIGRELAKILSIENYCVGIAARRKELLDSLGKEINSGYILQTDVSKTHNAAEQLLELIENMGGVDLVVICAGVGYLNPDLNWEMESETIDVNVRGFTCLADAAMRYFLKKGKGHLVGISSIAAIRGSGVCPAYNASKAYMSNYLEGLRCLANKKNKNIRITDIQPGLVDTRMAQGEKLFWVAKPEAAARQIYHIVQSGTVRGYVTRRWGLIAFCYKIMPEWLYRNI